MKIIIIGNSGSGKTWLATRLAVRGSATVVHLDHLFWEPDGFDKKRANDEIATLIEASKCAPAWIVEGVFGELAEQYMADADALIWLDLDWSVCRRRLESRGSESKAHMDRAQSEAGLKQLIEWAAAYQTRSDQRSFQGHLELFERFRLDRIQLRDEGEVIAFLDDIERDGFMAVFK